MRTMIALRNVTKTFGARTAVDQVSLTVERGTTHVLPIVRNAYTGMITVDRQLLEIAGALGLSRWQRLTWIELPLASINIMAGVKTSAVLTVGTATLARSSAPAATGR